MTTWLLLVPAAAFGWRGAVLIGRFARDREHADAPLHLVRGGRGVIVALACLALLHGLLAADRGWVAFGLAFLGEELYETGVVLLILRHDRRERAMAASA